MSAIFKRVSVRDYLVDEVPESIIHSLLHAGMSAPSSWNAQPWHFIVVKEKIKLTTIPSIHPYAKMTSQAPLAILVCGEFDSNKEKSDFFAQNCAAATENILIHATELKLGAVWVGIYPNEERMTHFRKLFNIPANIIPFALIPVGYPHRVDSKPKDRYISSKVHTNQW